MLASQLAEFQSGRGVAHGGAPVVGGHGLASGSEPEASTAFVNVKRLVTTSSQINAVLGGFIGEGNVTTTCKAQDISGADKQAVLRQHIAWAIVTEFPGIGATVEDLLLGRRVIQLTSAERSAVMIRARNNPARLLTALGDRLRGGIPTADPGPHMVLVNTTTRRAGTTMCDLWD